MFGTHDLILFLISGLLVCVVPGPDTLYIVGRSSAQGLRAGVTAALGIGAGILVHIVAAALGLSAVLATSATAFTTVKIVGAAYLVYVGLSLMRTSGASLEASPTRESVTPELRKIFLQGFLTDVLNVKVALFFLAFLPQFVTLEAASKPLALLFLGMIFNVTAILWNVFVAWSSARVAGGLMRSAKVALWFNRFVGALFIGIGIRIALTRHS